jgi:hypothetical protein
MRHHNSSLISFSFVDSDITVSVIRSDNPVSDSGSVDAASPSYSFQRWRAAARACFYRSSICISSTCERSRLSAFGTNQATLYGAEAATFNVIRRTFCRPAPFCRSAILTAASAYLCYLGTVSFDPVSFISLAPRLICLAVGLIDFTPVFQPMRRSSPVNTCCHGTFLSPLPLLR